MDLKLSTTVIVVNNLYILIHIYKHIPYYLLKNTIYSGIAILHTCIRIPISIVPPLIPDGYHHWYMHMQHIISNLCIDINLCQLRGTYLYLRTNTIRYIYLSIPHNDQKSISKLCSEIYFKDNGQ